MKRLHRPDLFAWSSYQPAQRIDFNSVLWVRQEGNVLVDPLPLIPEDAEHLRELGGAAWIVITNSAHVRAARDIAAWTHAKLAAPVAERETFPIACDRWIADGDELFPGLIARELDGSKTPGEVALVLDETTAIFGDLVRAHDAGTLILLPDVKLRAPAAARASLRRLTSLHPRIAHVLVGDGWCSFGLGGAMLDEVAGPT